MLAVFIKLYMGSGGVNSSTLKMYTKSATILWQMAIPVIVGWFAAFTWTNSNRWYAQLPKLLCTFCIACTVQKCGRWPLKTSWRTAVWRPMHYMKVNRQLPGPVALPLAENSLVPRWIGGWVGPRSRLYVWVKRKISCQWWDSNLDRPSNSLGLHIKYSC